MEIALFLFDGMTPLDGVGPFDVLGRIPGARVRSVSGRPGPCRTTGGGLALMADYGFCDVPRADVLVVPGGPGADELAENDEVSKWIAGLHETTRWTASVCTGALILGGAGVLDGLKAVTHWRAMEALAGYGALPTAQRVVRDGKVMTSAGVSAGIDMAFALTAELAGEETARTIQLALEYDPQPPFASGDFSKATPQRIHAARNGLAVP